MTSKAPDTRHSATSLIDESVHRLRLAPAGTLPIYYAGALPFVLALLYFWADQGHSPDAEAHGSAAALGIAGLFLWMKICQAVFAARLSASIRRQPDAPWTWARLARVAAVQTALQPSGLFVLCLAMLPAVLQLPGVSALVLSLLLTIPFGWTYAFYQNVTVAGDGAGSIRAVGSRAYRHALYQPKQNHAGLGVLSILALFVWANLIALVFLLPQLAHMFTGEENLFTRSGLHLFNTTFFAVTGALVYLALDPLAKTFYILRCFYMDSLHTGEDLQSELAALPPPATGVMTASGSRAAVAALALAGAFGLLLLGGSPARAAYAATPAPVPEASAAPAPGSVSPPALGRSIENVLRRREFAWRGPRTADAVKKDGPFDSFFDNVNHWWKERQAAMGRWFDDLLRKFSKGKRDQDDKRDASSSGLDPATLRAMLYTLIGLLAALLVFLAWRRLRGTRLGIAEGKAAPATGGTAPDLTDDSVLASQLPEDEWLQLARGLLDGGDRRLALRAFYLSVLAGLGERGLLAIARHKSNHDYLRELRRRARERDEMQGAFARNVSRFERVWYGEHPADDALLADFQADRQRVLG